MKRFRRSAFLALIYAWLTTLAASWEAPSLSDVLNMASTGVVRVSVTGFLSDDTGRRIRYEGRGSGFIYSNTGHVLTAAHLIPEDIESLIIEIELGIWVRVSRSDSVGASLEVLDRGLDQAVLKLDYMPVGARALPLAYGPGEMLEKVYALGFPAGVDYMTADELTIQDPYGRKLVLHGIANKGNSGGPILNAQGQVVGMLSDRLTEISRIPIQGIFDAVDIEDFLDPSYIDNFSSSQSIYLFPHMDMSWGQEDLRAEYDALPKSDWCGYQLPTEWTKARTADGFKITPAPGSLLSRVGFVFEIRKGGDQRLLPPLPSVDPDSFDRLDETRLPFYSPAPESSLVIYRLDDSNRYPLFYDHGQHAYWAPGRQERTVACHFNGARPTPTADMQFDGLGVSYMPSVLIHICEPILASEFVRMMVEGIFGEETVSPECLP